MDRFHGEFEFELEGRRASETLLHDSQADSNENPSRVSKEENHRHAPVTESEASASKIKSHTQFAWLPNLHIETQMRWLYELLCGLVSIIALLAIIITLSTHQGRPIPDWPFRISVNALVSVFAVILKGALMIPVAEAISQLKWIWYSEPHELSDLTEFDLASRGPGGAAKLLFIQRGLHLASLGAIITLLVVAVDPFIQQVIKYHGCSQSVLSIQASVSRTNNYTAHGIHTGALQSSLDVAMQAAIYKGVYDSFSAVPLQCPSGNCTYPHYRSVGICAECEDVTKTVEHTCNASIISNNETVCWWTLPSGMFLSNLDSSTTMVVAPGPGYSYTIDDTSISKTEILTFTSIGGYDTVQDDSEVVAAHCRLSPCVQTYTANVTNNIPTEVVLTTQLMEPRNWTEYLEPYQRFTLLTMPCLLAGEYMYATEFTTRPPDNETGWLVVVGLLPDDQPAYIPLECYFWLDESSVFSLVQYLPLFLQGNVTDEVEVGIASFDAPWIGQVLYNDRKATFSSIETAWAALAESMTVQMRVNGDPTNSKNTTGWVINPETCISVRWAWLALPASLIAFMFLFLLATMIHTARHENHHIWKGSPLALMFHGLDDETRDQQMLLEEINEMDRVAKNLRVQMRNTDSGWLFVREDHS